MDRIEKLAARCDELATKLRALAQTSSEIRQSLFAHLRNGTPCVILYNHNDEVVDAESFVVSIHSDFVVLGRIYQTSWINGWQALRLKSVVRVSPTPDADFILRAMEANRITIPLPPPIECDTFLDFLGAVCNKFPIVTTDDDPAMVHPSAAGSIINVNSDSISIRSMSTKGFWERDPHRIELRHITHVLFGSKYEQILERIGRLPESHSDGDVAQ